MQVNESLYLSRYIRILEYNKKSKEEIKTLTKEYIDYIEGVKKDNLSDELKQYLSFLENLLSQSSVEEVSENNFHKGV